MRAVLYALTVLLSLTSVIFAAPTLRLEIVELPPFQYGEAGKIKGLGVEKVRALLTKAGASCTISLAEHYGVAVQDLRDDKCDGIFLATRNATRDKLAIFVGPIMPYRSTWCLLADSKFEPSSKNFVRKARVGAMTNSNNFIFLITHQYNIGYSAPAPKQLLESLLKGDNDAILIADLAFLDLIEKAGKPKSAFKMVLREEQEYGLYISRKFAAGNPGLIEKLNQALPSIR